MNRNDFVVMVWLCGRSFYCSYSTSNLWKIWRIHRHVYFEGLRKPVLFTCENKWEIFQQSPQLDSGEEKAELSLFSHRHFVNLFCYSSTTFLTGSLVRFKLWVWGTIVIFSLRVFLLHFPSFMMDFIFGT